MHTGDAFADGNEQGCACRECLRARIHLWLCLSFCKPTKGRGGQELQTMAGDQLLQPGFPLGLAGSCACRSWGLGKQGGRIPSRWSYENDQHSTYSQYVMPAMGSSWQGWALLSGQVRINSQSLLLLDHEAQIAQAEFLITDAKESWVLLLREVSISSRKGQLQMEQIISIWVLGHSPLGLICKGFFFVNLDTQYLKRQRWAWKKDLLSPVCIFSPLKAGKTLLQLFWAFLLTQHLRYHLREPVLSLHRSKWLMVKPFSVTSSTIWRALFCLGSSSEQQSLCCSILQRKNSTVITVSLCTNLNYITKEYRNFMYTSSSERARI